MLLQVPTLLVGETALTQSMAILEYLEETHPENAMLPEDSGDFTPPRRLQACSYFFPFVTCSMFVAVAFLVSY